MMFSGESLIQISSQTRYLKWFQNFLDDTGSKSWDHSTGVAVRRWGGGKDSYIKVACVVVKISCASDFVLVAKL